MHQTPSTASQQHNLNESSTYAAFNLFFIVTFGDLALLPPVSSMASVAPFLAVPCQQTCSASMHHTPSTAPKQHNLTESSAYVEFYVVLIAMYDY